MTPRPPSDRSCGFRVLPLFCGFALAMMALNSLRISGQPPQSPRFRLIDLGKSEHGVFLPHDLNELGVLVGYVESPNKPVRPASWKNGRITLLPDGPARKGEANAINEIGVIVGYVAKSSGKKRAVSWTDGRIRDLGTLGGVEAQANDINDRSEIVGRSHSKSGHTRPTLWTNGQIRDLGSFGGYAEATAINARSEIVGFSENEVMSPRAEYEDRAFLFTGGKMFDLTEKEHAFLRAYASDINDLGMICGYWNNHGSGYEALFWDRDRVMATVSSPDGPDGAFANGINNRGDIVGTGFLYFRGRTFPLKPLLVNGKRWTIEYATAINDKRQIACVANYRGRKRGCLLVPFGR